MNQPNHHDNTYEEKVEKMATMTVAAAKGIVPAAQVSLTLTQIAGSDLAPPEARALAGAFIHILNGERDPIVLAGSLPPDLAELLWETLEQIEAPLPEEETPERTALTFEELIEKVAEACTGQIVLWQQLWIFTEELAEDARLSPDIRALGSVLRKVLAGERQKHILENLSADHRWAVEQLLDWLREQTAEPPPD